MHRVQQRPLVVGMLYPVCWRVGGYTAYPPGKESLSCVDSVPLLLPALFSPNTSFINPRLAAVTNQPQMCWGLKQKECASRLWTRPRPGCPRWVGGSALPRHYRSLPGSFTAVDGSGSPWQTSPALHTEDRGGGGTGRAGMLCL